MTYYHPFISIEEFVDKPYSDIIGYPKATKQQISARIKELKRLQIKAISISGPTTILGSIQVLGKGYAGVVVVAKKDKIPLMALKIRRTDSQRDSMKDEAKLLKLANTVCVGPKMLDVSRNFLVMELVEGTRIYPWISSLKGPGSTVALKSTIKKILEDCYKLDKVGLDHGEISNITKHIIITEKKPVLIDFESSSTSRKTSNVTSVTQAIYIGSGIAKKVHRVYRLPTKEVIIMALKKYKIERTDDSFNELLKTLKLKSSSKAK